MKTCTNCLGFIPESGENFSGRKCDCIFQVPKEQDCKQFTVTGVEKIEYTWQPDIRDLTAAVRELTAEYIWQPDLRELTAAVRELTQVLREKK